MENLKQRKNVLAHGTFDLLHAGHFNLLHKASELGDLYVVVRPDEEASLKKGVPLAQNEELRLANVMLLDIVKDAAISGYDVEKSVNLVKKWDIDYIVVGSDHVENKHIIEICDKASIEMVVLNRTDGISSTTLRNKINKN